MSALYSVRFLDQVEEHLRWLDAGQRKLVLNAISVQLRHQPDRDTRNRRRMRKNPLADYRLRVRNLRVYYDVDPAARVVIIKAVGRKMRDKVLVGAEEIEL